MLIIHTTGFNDKPPRSWMTTIATRLLLHSPNRTCCARLSRSALLLQSRRGASRKCAFSLLNCPIQECRWLISFSTFCHIVIE